MSEKQTFTDQNGRTHETDRERDIAFIKDMEEAGIEWDWYSGRGMYGRQCPSVTTSDGVSDEDIIRATQVRGLRRDNMGYDTVLYTG